MKKLTKKLKVNSVVVSKLGQPNVQFIFGGTDEYSPDQDGRVEMGGSDDPFCNTDKSRPTGICPFGTYAVCM